MNTTSKCITYLSLLLGGCALLPADAPHQRDSVGVSAEETGACPAPAWYGSRGSKPPVWAGYGRGDSETRALDQAYANVAKQISTRVTARCNDHQRRQQTSGGEESWVTEQSCQLTSQAQSELELARVTRRHQCNQSYFVEVVWDQRPLHQRLSPLVHGQTVSQVPVPLVKAFERAGASVTGEGNPISVDWHDGLWGLEINNNKLTLTETSLWQALDWRAQPLPLKPVPATLRFQHGGQPVNRAVAGEELDMVLQAPAEGGFITIINVHDNGQVTVLLENAPRSAGQRWRLKSHLKPGQARSKEGYLALISQEKLDLSPFVGQTGIRGTGNHKALADLLSLTSDVRLTNLATTQLLITRAH